MANIPQTSPDLPIVGDAPDFDAGAGQEAIAQAIPKATGDIIATDMDVKQAASNTMLYTQSALIDQARRDATTQMRINPSQAPQIQQNYENTVQGLSNNVNLLPMDKARLGAITDASSDAVNNGTVLAQGRLYRAQEAANFWTNYPATLKQIQTNLMSPDNSPQQQAAQTQIGVINKMLSDGLSNNFISPQEYANGQKALQSVLDQHQQLLNAMETPGVPIDGLHALTNFDNTPNPGLPTQAPAFFQYGVAKQNLSYQDAIAGLHSGIIYSNAASSLTSDQFNKYIQTQGGISNAVASINSGNSYQYIQKRMGFLGSLPAADLTVAEKGEYDQYKLYTNTINSGNMLQALEKTSMGSQIFDHYNASTAAIMSNQALTQQQKQDQLNQSFGDFSNSMVALGHALNLPPDKINPVPNPISVGINSGFSLNADPSQVTGQLNKYSIQNGVYAANAVSNPVQAQTANIVNSLRGQNQDQFSNNLILANQTGRDYSNIKYPSGVNPSTIANDLVSQSPDIFNFIKSQPNGAQQIQAITKSAVNYVKYQAQQNNDFSLDNLSDYEKGFLSSFNKSVNLTTGNNYQINTNKLPVTPAQSQALADYLISKTQNNMNQSAPFDYVSNLLASSPLRIVSTDDGHLMMMNDRNTQVGSPVLFSQPLLAKAVQWEAAKRDNNITQPGLATRESQNLWAGINALGMGYGVPVMPVRTP